MDPTNKTGQLPAVRVEPALYDKIAAEAEASFETVAEIVRRRIALAYANAADAGPLPMTAAQELRQRRETLAVEALERAAAKDRKEMLTVDEAVTVVEKDYGLIRQSLLSFAQSAALDLGLDDDRRDKLADLVQNLMTDLSGEQRETFDELAKQH